MSVRSFARRVRKRVRMLMGQGKPYQAKTAPSVDARWQMMEPEIPAGAGSLLDIGSNLGNHTARAAERGMWALGVELEKALVEQAFRRHGDVPLCAFTRTQLDLEACRRLPVFDVILVLSVYHHWHLAYGAETTKQMLRALAAKTSSVMMFEGPSRTMRFVKDQPTFVDNSEQSVTEFYDRYLADSVGDLFREIKLLGKAPCVGDREPYRWIYALHK